MECDQEHFVKYWNEVQLCGTFTSVFPFFSEAFNVRSRKMFDFLLHCIYFDTFRHELLCRSHAASEPIQHRF